MDSRSPWVPTWLGCLGAIEEMLGAEWRAVAVWSGAGTDPSTAPVWFVFTDIEGSTAHWDESPEVMRAALAHHDRLLSAAFEAHGGNPFKHTGDGVLAAFGDARSAVAAAVAAQRALVAESFGELGGLRVRMGVHGGMVHTRDGDYFGPVLNRAARVMDAGNGGEIVATEDVVTAVGTALARDDIGFADLGVHRLKGLARPMVLARVLHPDLESEFPPLRSMNASLTNISSPAARLFGRERELQELARLIDTPGLITLLGTGGVGKTSLARQAALAASHRFPDGTWFCDLAAVREPDVVAEAVAGVLGIERRGSQPIVDTLRDALFARTALIILDNCEHLTAAVANVVRGVMVGSSALRFLATSRQPIGVPDERRLRVAPLSLPTEVGAPSDAVALFMDRASANGYPVERTEESDRTITRICEELDGLPLAIELAAARTAVLHIDEIAARLGQRLRLLRNASGDDERHHTLKATLDWSHDLLDTEEQCLFAMLGCFEGGFDLEAIVAVSALDEFDVVDLIDGLVAKSLIELAHSPARRRFRLLETVREYAAAKFEDTADRDAVLRRYAAHYAAVVRRARPHLRTPEALDWVQQLYDDIANLRRAFHYWLQHDPPTAAEMPVSLWSVWTSRMLVDEGVRWLNDAHDALDPADPLAAQVTDDSLAWTRGDNAQAEQSCRDALERARAEGVEPRPTVLVRLAVIYFQSGRPRDAAPLLEDALRLYRAGYEPTDKVELLSALGATLAFTGETARGAALCDEGVAIARAESPGVLVSALNNASLAFALVDPAKGAATAEESLAMARSIGSRYGVGNALSSLGFAKQLSGDQAASRRAYADSLPALRDSGQRGAVAQVLDQLAVLLRRPAPVGSIALQAMSAKLHAEMNDGDDDDGVRQRARQTRTRTNPSITDEDVGAAWARGLTLSFDDAVDEVLMIVDEVDTLAYT